MYVVKIACERPDELGRSLSQWDCTEIARQLVRDGVVSKSLSHKGNNRRVTGVVMV